MVYVDACKHRTSAEMVLTSTSVYLPFVIAPPVLLPAISTAHTGWRLYTGQIGFAGCRRYVYPASGAAPTMHAA